MRSAYLRMDNTSGLTMICCVILLLLSIKAQSQAPCFNANITRGCVPLTITVDDACANYAPAPNPPLKYNYGDGAGGPNAAVFDKTHTYTQPGRYAITQYGTFNATGDSLRKDNYIEVLPVPEPTFTLGICAGRSVSLELTDTAYDSYLINWGMGLPYSPFLVPICISIPM